ncbi:hypothetical protein FAM09_02205 [Niastella caeni]|uniref:JmjC domain-containing protein n=1 Tax=Niastella caeni TaxID=2569763 RepID=A0A4S8HZ40_9BACT|nr:hypothetical protein [Niastella caeni]THU40950.1 hypothetical protein FAM09_02205 [Niastella caeni]
MNASSSEIVSAKINEPAITINNTWWDLFLEKTNHFTNTTVIKDAMSGTECNEIKEMVGKVIREVCRAKTDQYGFRVYVDGVRVSGEELENTIFPQPPQLNEEVESWGERLFPGKKIGMIINSGEKFCNELAQRLSIYAAPLLEKVGIPLNGLHSTIFVGNYGLTPLGIHQDHRGANVIHFHVGPGGKIMYTWKEQQFNELLAGRNKKDVPVEELLPHANKFPFGKGDIYFMPWDQFHIGHSDEFSIGVTLWFDNHVRTHVLNNLLESFRIQYLDMEDTTVTVPEKTLNDLKGYADIDAVLKIDEHLSTKTFPEFLNVVYEEYMFSLFSNQGWSTLPLSLSEEHNFDENDYAFLADKEIRAVHPFKILYKIISEVQKVQLYARGSKIELNFHQEIVDLVNKLNEGSTYKVSLLTEQVFKELPAEVALYMLSLLLNKRSIELID